MVSRWVLRYLLFTGPWGYLLGTLAAAIATVIQLAFRDFFYGVPFLLFFPATLLATFFGGWRAGVASAIVSTLFATYFFVGKPSSFGLDLADWFRVVLFDLVSGMIVALIAILQGVSAQLQSERDRVRMLARETNHRVANSLQLVASALQLQSRSVKSPELSRELETALSRVKAISRVHERLHKGIPGPTLPVADYLTLICADIAKQVGVDAQCDVNCDAIELDTDKAIKLGLIVSELVVNAFKHLPTGRKVDVHCRKTGDEFALTIADGGPGFPVAFDPAKSKGLGMKIVSALTKEMGGQLAFYRHEGRAAVEVAIPL